MRQKLTILITLIILGAAMAFMVYDFFQRKQLKNPYEYSLDKFKKVDSTDYCFKEVHSWKPEMEKIRGIALDSEENIYVTGKSKVIAYDKKGNLINAFKINEEARNIAIAGNDEIYLGVWDHVEVWSKEGKLLRKWNKFGDRSIVTSIAVTENEVFVADFGDRIVYRCDANGNILNKIGEKDSTKGIKGFFIPSPYFDLTLGRDGELWVVNPGYHQFEAYDFEGNLISSWKRTSMQLDGFSGCCNPSHIAILSDGSFVTSEKGIERVKIHLPSGDYKCLVAGPDQFEEETIGLDLAVDSEDRVYVLDPKKGLVRVFEEI